jgi:macrolide-specific efflux system membrane fusion protein
VTKFRVGQEGTVVLDSFPDKAIDGKVTMIGFTPKTGETGTVYELRIAFVVDNSDYSIRMGMTGDVNFVFKEVKGVIAIPSSYIKTDKNEKYVWKMAGKNKEKTIVTTGETIDGNTEIVSGLNEKDVIYSN